MCCVPSVTMCVCVCFQVFTLPTMRPYGKFKLTATEGSRVRRIGYARSVSGYFRYSLPVYPFTTAHCYSLFI